MILGEKTLITGGCGYIGFNLANELMSIGCETVVLFDLTAPKFQDDLDTNQNFSHVGISAGKNRKPNIIYVEGDIRDFQRLDETIKLHRINSVFHIAGYGLSGHSNLPIYDDVTNSVNVLGTKNVVQACLENNVKALGSKNTQLLLPLLTSNYIYIHYFIFITFFIISYLYISLFIILATHL